MGELLATASDLLRWDSLDHVLGELREVVTKIDLLRLVKLHIDVFEVFNLANFRGIVLLQELLDLF